MIVVLMGVTSSGKTTVGKVLATELGWRFYDADDYHPPRPWREYRSCRSALKHAYQEYLRHHLDVVRYVCLCGPPEVIQRRLASRTGHFMNPALLPSQFEMLEPPEDAIRVDVTGTPDEIAGEIRRRLGP